MCWSKDHGSLVLVPRWGKAGNVKAGGLVAREDKAMQCRAGREEAGRTCHLCSEPATSAASMAAPVVTSKMK